MTRDITVIVPTHNRRASIVRLLDGLAAGTTAPERFEVVVVADGCEDDTLAALHATVTPFALRVLSQSPARGAATARNLGAAESLGEILLFVDDDIEPLPAMLAAHLELHAASPTDPTLVVGAPIPVRSPADGFHHIAVWSWWEQQFERMRQPGYRFSYCDIFSGILSLRASTFQAAGGFDAGLPKSCRDDWELGLRLLRLGVPVVFSREAGGYHHDMRDHTRLTERKEAEGRSDLELARLHPELRPDLRLAEPCGPWRSGTGLMRRLAFFAPRSGRLLVSGLTLLLRPLEWIRLRVAWRRVHGAAMYFAYWRGVAAALGGGARARAALRGLIEGPPADARFARIIELDLSAGLPEAERILDQERPNGVWIRLGSAEIGLLPSVPGAEVLRGRHLREQLATSLVWELALALALGRAQARAQPSEGHAP